MAFLDTLHWLLEHPDIDHTTIDRFTRTDVRVREVATEHGRLHSLSASSFDCPVPTHQRHADAPTRTITMGEALGDPDLCRSCARELLVHGQVLAGQTTPEVLIDRQFNATVKLIDGLRSVVQAARASDVAYTSIAWRHFQRPSYTAVELTAVNAIGNDLYEQAVDLVEQTHPEWLLVELVALSESELGKQLTNQLLLYQSTVVGRRPDLDRMLDQALEELRHIRDEDPDHLLVVRGELPVCRLPRPLTTAGDLSLYRLPLRCALAASREFRGGQAVVAPPIAEDRLQLWLALVSDGTSFDTATEIAHALPLGA